MSFHYKEEETVGDWVRKCVCARVQAGMHTHLCTLMYAVDVHKER